jgi:hypothetical protein
MNTYYKGEFSAAQGKTVFPPVFRLFSSGMLHIRETIFRP